MDVNKLQTNRIQEVLGNQNQATSLNKQPKAKGPSFSDVLNNELVDKKQVQNAQLSSVRFSNHALDRIRSRGIQMGPEQLQKLEQAVDKAQAKGARETLVLMDETAMIVNIKNKTVVTALDQNMMKENVFTNIDSTVIL